VEQMARSGLMTILAVGLLLAGCGSSTSTGSSTSVASQASARQPSTPTATKPPAPTTTSAKASTHTAGKAAVPAPAPAKPAKSGGEGPKPEEKVGGTPFLAATGRGFGAFHNYISKPLRKNELVGGAGSPAIKIAATAALYAAKEVAGAAQAVSHEAALHGLEAPLAQLATNLGRIGASLSAGQAPEAAIVAARTEVNSISRAALAAGQPIQEIVPTLK
jgi:hypothetical protein